MDVQEDEVLFGELKGALYSKAISILLRHGVTSEDFKRKTGAYLCTEKWTLEGSLVTIMNGMKFIEELEGEEYEAPNFSTQNRNRSANSPDSKTDTGVVNKYSITCSIHEEKALRELFLDTELPFSSVNIFEVKAGEKGISGTQKNVIPFEKALSELHCQDISEIPLMEFQDFVKKKLENVSVSFDKERQTMIIISRSPELLKRSIEEFRRLQDDILALTEEEFNFIIFFEKSLSRDFPKIDGKIMVKGPKSFVNKYRQALDKLKKYPFQRISITDRVSGDAETFLSQFSRENKNVYIQIKDKKIFITGKKTHEVFLAKQRIDEQLEIMRKRNKGLTSNDVSEQCLAAVRIEMNVKSGVPDVNLVSPKETDIVFQKSNVRVYVLNANILQVKADAIVNPMSTDLSHSILREAGSSVKRQCSEVLDSKRNNILQIGEAFVTDGGNLSHLLKIIHVNVPNWNNYAELEVGSPCEKCIEDIAETVKVSLEKGNDNNVCAIAIPHISKCGVGSVPLPVCGRAYVSAVTSYIDAYPKSSTNKIREIYFVDTDQTKLDSIKFAFSGFQHWVFLQADNEEHFYHGGGTVLKIFASEILFADAEALVAPQEGEMKSERYIAKSLKRCECKAYAGEIAKFHGCTWPVGDIRTTSAPKSLKFFHILHVYSPSWRSDVSLDVKIKDLRTCIQNVFKEASKLKLGTIAIPTFGGGIKYNIDKQRVFKETARAIVECLGGTPDSTVRVISIIDSDTLNITLMISEFYKILSQDGRYHNTDVIDVQRPNLQMKETELNLKGILV
ncbi:uncharacterized protein LOC134231508 [Saccostrea cucullata]|uniref:uncharacterized protein LOC134231508 n=1 Tax=Saccostrea cuccullata TaxID=36930 RepID=UPI002ED2CD34